MAADRIKKAAAKVLIEAGAELQRHRSSRKGVTGSQWSVRGFSLPTSTAESLKIEMRLEKVRGNGWGFAAYIKPAAAIATI